MTRILVRSVFFTILLSTILMGCGDTKTPDPPESKTAPQQAETKTSPPEPAKAAGEALPKTVLNARAEIAPPREGFPEGFDVSIRIAENSAAWGSATVGKDALTLSGAVLNNSIRLWVSGSKETFLKGGFFIGEMSDNHASGNFAISGNGGNPDIRGTWKTL